jgi:hypothetical protein
MPQSDLGHAILGGPPGPNSELLEDRCTNSLETYTIEKGSKFSARQCQKAT